MTQVHVDEQTVLDLAADHGLRSVSAIARHVGVDYFHLRKVLKGKVTTPAYVNWLAKSLGAKPADLVRRQPDQVAS